VLKVSIRVLTWQTTELVCLHYHDEAGVQLKVSSPSVDSGKGGQNTRYPIPEPELPEPRPEVPEPKIPDHNFG
jgi:hypothetical protein